MAKKSAYIAVKPYGTRPSKIHTFESAKAAYGCTSRNFVDLGQFACKHNVPYQGLMMITPTTMLCQNLKNFAEFRVWDTNALTKIEG